MHIEKRNDKNHSFSLDSFSKNQLTFLKLKFNLIVGMRVILCDGKKNSPHKKNHANKRMITEIFFQTKDSISGNHKIQRQYEKKIHYNTKRILNKLTFCIQFILPSDHENRKKRYKQRKRIQN